MRSNQRWPRCTARIRTAAPMEWPSAKIGGGQSGSTTSRTKVSRSMSNSGEAPDVTFEAIAQRTIRQALTAPIEHRDGKSAIAQVANGLEIFLDPFGAAGEDTHRAAPARRRRKARKPQRNAIGRFQHAGNSVVRNRIGRNRDESHKPLFTGVLAPLAAIVGHPHVTFAQARDGCVSSIGLALKAGPRMSLQKEDMPCELSI